MDGMINFDDALATQTIFREVMNAFAHPLRVHNIGNAEDSPLAELCGVFLDNTVSFYVHGDDPLAAYIRKTTYSRSCALKDADFVIIPNAKSFDEWDKLRCGTLLDPHKGATVIIAVPQIMGDEKISSQGPGIDGKRAFGVHESIIDCAEKAAALEIEYPMGFELLFVAQSGDICALPRRIKVERECD